MEEKKNNNSFRKFRDLHPRVETRVKRRGVYESGRRGRRMYRIGRGNFRSTGGRLASATTATFHREIRAAAAIYDNECLDDTVASRIGIE